MCMSIMNKLNNTEAQNCEMNGRTGMSPRTDEVLIMSGHRGNNSFMIRPHEVPPTVRSNLVSKIQLCFSEGDCLLFRQIWDDLPWRSGISSTILEGNLGMIYLV